MRDIHVFNKRNRIPIFKTAFKTESPKRGFELCRIRGKRKTAIFMKLNRTYDVQCVIDHIDKNRISCYSGSGAKIPVHTRIFPRIGSIFHGNIIDRIVATPHKRKGGKASTEKQLK